MCVIRNEATSLTDTSVIGGCLDTEFQVPSMRLIERFKLGEAIVVLSELTVLELASAPAKLRGVLSAVPEAHKELRYTED